jgi:hypothetical protein
MPQNTRRHVYTPMINPTVIVVGSLTVIFMVLDIWKSDRQIRERERFLNILNNTIDKFSAPLIEAILNPPTRTRVVRRIHRANPRPRRQTAAPPTPEDIDADFKNFMRGIGGAELDK